MATITPAAVFPVSGDFDTTNPFSGTFIPSIWSGKLNAKFFDRTTFGAVSNTNWQGDISGKGDKVIINNVPTITINDYVAGGGLTYEVPEPDTLELVIDQGKYFGVQVNDVLSYQAQPNLMDMFTNDAAEQLKVAIDTNCWYATFNGAAAANKGATAGVNSGAYDLGTDLAAIDLDGDNILATILAMASVLDEQNVPETERWLVLTPRERFLLMQSNLAQAYYTGDATSPVRNGKVGMIDRFELYVTNLLPRAAVGKNWDGTNLTDAVARHAIVAGHKSAITFAAQISKTENIRNPDDFGDIVRGLSVFGRKVVKPEAMVTLVAAG